VECGRLDGRVAEEARMTKNVCGAMIVEKE
jgi:hypothetical protein